MHVYAFMILMGRYVGQKSPNGTIKHLATFSRYIILYVSNYNSKYAHNGMAFLLVFLFLSITFLLLRQTIIVIVTITAATASTAEIIIPATVPAPRTDEVPVA